ncbi:MAG: ATP synthase subunit c [Proteobacteria bacterium]|jgi:F-type H+-transporting ATPase subunit c|nr:MAG: ATP synthase subunit c [Pseudomonadota bacterium]|tara:strand:+ start:933 stop:1163 length:231 start_codon:yes stop_codon:yes gene_type:complete
MELTLGLKAIGAGLACLGMIGAGLGLGNLVGKYFESIARQPEAEDKLKGMFFIGLAIVEAIALFAFTVAMIIIFVL